MLIKIANLNKTIKDFFLSKIFHQHDVAFHHIKSTASVRNGKSGNALLFQPDLPAQLHKPRVGAYRIENRLRL